MSRTLLIAAVLVFASCAVDSDEGDRGGDGDGSGMGDGSGLGDGGGDGDGEPTDGVLSYMDACEVANDQCNADDDLFCFSYTMRGSRCTHECAGADECASPSPGCNGKGVCKSP